MAKDKVKGRTRSSPYLRAALVCERMLIEADKVASIMRLVDQVTLPRPVSPFPRNTVVAINLHFVVSFRSGSFRGKLPLKIERTGPAGETAAFFEHQMEFAG